MRWRNVDLPNGAPNRREPGADQGRARFRLPRPRVPAPITLPRFAIDELARLKREQAEALLAWRATDRRYSGCARADGEPMQPRSPTHEFARLMGGQRKDLPRVRFHDLRHSHATQPLEAGIHPKVAQERLGHSTITTTLDLYSHVTDTMQEEAATRLDDALGGAIRGQPAKIGRLR